MNPAASASTMLGVADAQEVCDDKEGARASAQEAAYFCEGIKDPAVRGQPRTLCRPPCALGDKGGWTRYWDVARRSAEQVGNPNSDARLRQPVFGEIVAYEEAGDAANALAAAQGFEKKFCLRRRVVEPDWMAEQNSDCDRTGFANWRRRTSRPVAPPREGAAVCSSLLSRYCFTISAEVDCHFPI